MLKALFILFIIVLLIIICCAVVFIRYANKLRNKNRFNFKRLYKE